MRGVLHGFVLRSDHYSDGVWRPQLFKHSLPSTSETGKKERQMCNTGLTHAHLVQMLSLRRILALRELRKRVGSLVCREACQAMKSDDPR